MVRHIALFRFAPDVTDEQRATVVAALSQLPGQIPELRDYRFGPDLGLSDGNFDFAVVADVDDDAAYRVYAEHPAHRAVIVDVIRPIISERAAVQYTW